MPADCNIISYSQSRNALATSDFNFIKDPWFILTNPINLSQKNTSGEFTNLGSFMAEGVGNLKIEWNYGDRDSVGRLFWHWHSDRQIWPWWEGKQLPKAIKFTFTLYDSKGILKEGRIFTHIVYLGN
jgi:hypothetical protein